MPSPTPCTPCCPTPQSVNIPGVEGQPGADGANGINAFSILVGNTVLPAIGSNQTFTVSSNQWMAIGQVIVFDGPYTFQVVSLAGTTIVVAKFLGYPLDLLSGPIPNGSTVSPSGQSIVELAGFSTGQSVVSNTLIDLTGLVIACAPNSTYIFEAVINCSAATGTDGAQFGVDYSNATQGVVDFIFQGQKSNVPAWAPPERIQAWATANATAVCIVSADVTQQRLAGYFTTLNAAANFSIQALKVTSQTLSIFPGSWVRVTKVA